MDSLFALLFFIFLILLCVGVIKPALFERVTKQSYNRGRVLKHFGLGAIIFFVLFGFTADKKTSAPVSTQRNSVAVNTDEKKQEASTSTKSVVKLEEKPVVPETQPTQTPPKVVTQERIREIVSGVGGLLAVTYDKNDNMVMDQTENPPYAITINTSASDIKDCFDAKDKLFELSKRLYTDPAVGSKISRVKFTAWKQLRASIGSDDVKELKWSDLGPTNFWRTTLRYKGYEDETGDLAKRTWGVAINPECK